MTADSFVMQQAGAYEIRGLLTFTTVPDLLPHSASWLGKDGPVTVDLQQVTRADSAGLALMIEWLRQARAGNTELLFTHIPSQLATLIRVSGLQDLIPLGQD